MKQCNNVSMYQCKRFERHLRGEIFRHLGGERSQRANRGFNSGAALVITLIVVTVISAIAFSVSRSLVSEVKQITRLEDSEMAYQAAESGIEAGLLLYRYNHDVEVPANVTGGMDENVAKAMRVNVTTGILEVDSFDMDANLISMKKTEEYYDLRIWHKNPNVSGVSTEKVESEPCKKVTNIDGTESYPEYCVADDPNIINGTQSIPALAKDGSVEYNINKLDGKIYLKWGYKKVPTNRQEIEQMRLEYVTYDENGEIAESGRGKELFLYEDSNNGSFGNGIQLFTTNAQNIRVKSWGGDLDNYQMTLTNSSNKLDSRYTYIESTGYYGGSKRKLKVKIDRQTGSIISTYDFVLLSPGSITGQ